MSIFSHSGVDTFPFHITPASAEQRKSDIYLVFPSYAVQSNIGYMLNTKNVHLKLEAKDFAPRVLNSAG